MEELYKAGRIRAIGVSNFYPAALRSSRSGNGEVAWHAQALNQGSVSRLKAIVRFGPKADQRTCRLEGI
ncbi:hypothetical protein [Ensifer adhaerens]|uniref:hypothetical protein n=1 Tax=Ensifer adhaerens TaxID=106592 RepID=UPI002351E946|nr:hypothetical protein [Ensifer adhaerens]